MKEISIKEHFKTLSKEIPTIELGYHNYFKFRNGVLNLETNEFFEMKNSKDLIVLNGVDYEYKKPVDYSEEEIEKDKYIREVINQIFFIYLLKNEIEEVYNSHKSTNNLVKILRKHSFGTSFRFTTLLSRLSNKYGLDIDTKNPMRCIRTDFINNIISCYTNFIFRGFKYRCRIPVPNSWTLVGIADEGPAYISQKRYKACDVFTLRKGQIYGMINHINIYFKNLPLITS